MTRIHFCVSVWLEFSGKFGEKAYSIVLCCNGVMHVMSYSGLTPCQAVTASLLEQLANTH